MSTVQTDFRLETKLLARVDAYARELQKKTPGLKVTRADAVRILLEKALATRT